MAQVQGPLPYDLANLLGGAARVLLSDDSAESLPDVPTNINDVIECVSPYQPREGWIDVGATTEGTGYSRNMESEGYEIEQVRGAVFEEITEVSRQLSVSMGEVRPELVKIAEEAGGVEDVAAVTDEAVAQKAVKFGSFQDLTPRRAAFIGQRNRRSGTVTEAAAGRQRGRFVMAVLYIVTLAAEESEVTLEKGSLSGLPVTFTAFPEGGQDFGEEYGVWLFEDEGTIGTAPGP